MPAAVFVIQAVCRKRRQRLRLQIRRLRLAVREFAARQFIGFGDVNPVLSVRVRVKLDAVRIFQIR